ncbi:unnamed protein product [Scytosiphon promiscuus]
MSYLMPLAGDGTSETMRDRLLSEERAFRMLSEGELFYVETDVHEDRLDSARHDHGHLGGVSLETITAARFLGQQPAAKQGPGSTGTEATSRSSSQDTQENDNNTWQQQPYRNNKNVNNYSNSISLVDAGKHFYSSKRISLKEAQEWDFSKKLDELAASESRGRERSFSEPRLSSMARPFAGPNNDVGRGGGGNRCHEKHLEWSRPQQRRQQQEERAMGTVDESCSSTAGWKMPKAMPPNPQPHYQPRTRQQPQGDCCACRSGGVGGGDACAGVAEGLQRAWGWVLACGREGHGEEEQNPGIGSLRSKPSTRVNSVYRNYASCTSTKTFEVSARDREALAKLGVVPETGFRGVGAPASMTFTMHVAGYRVVSTILGMHAEYEVCVKGGGRRWCKWQRFSKFKMIAACTQGDPDAASAWTQVLRAKPHYRCLNPEYLAIKCNLLEVFLQQVLFAMPTPALLIHFVSQKK